MLSQQGTCMRECLVCLLVGTTFAGMVYATGKNSPSRIFARYVARLKSRFLPFFLLYIHCCSFLGPTGLCGFASHRHHHLQAFLFCMVVSCTPKASEVNSSRATGLCTTELLSIGVFLLFSLPSHLFLIYWSEIKNCLVYSLRRAQRSDIIFMPNPLMAIILLPYFVLVAPVVDMQHH